VTDLQQSRVWVARADTVSSGPGSASPPAQELGAPAEPFVTFYCENCFDVGHRTDRGVLCERCYERMQPICEMCGMYPAVIRENGYAVCLTGTNAFGEGRCLAKARGAA